MQHMSSRRDFIKGAAIMIGGAIGAFVGIPSAAYLLSPAVEAVETDAWISLGALENYAPGTPTLFEFTRTHVNGWERTAISYGAYVLRQGNSAVRVYSNVCTHLGCRVRWRPELRHYVSPCHDGHFEMDGTVVSGPPPRPLDEFKTRIQEGQLYIEVPAFRRTF
jgi:menaquinol-cytochrome c reductase iron-sulfur subunit